MYTPNDPENQDIVKLIELIQKRRQMCFKEKSILNLYSFLNWFISWMKIQEIDNLPVNIKKYYEFWKYILKKTNSKRILFHEALLDICKNDTEKAYDKFFELFDEFKKEKWLK